MFMQLRDVTGTVLAGIRLRQRPAKFFARAAAQFHQSQPARRPDLLGHTLEIDVLAAGCSQGGHGGYVLFDAFGSAVVPPSGTIQLPTLHLSTTSLGYNTPTASRPPRRRWSSATPARPTAARHLHDLGANARLLRELRRRGRCNAGGIVAQAPPAFSPWASRPRPPA
jgi:hypothetical protein